MKKIVFLLLSAALLLSACGQEMEAADQTSIYYLSKDHKQVKSVNKPVNASNVEEWVSKIKEMLVSGTDTNVDGDLLGDLSVTINSTELNGPILTVDLSSSYYKLSISEQVFARLIIAKTFTENEDIRVIKITSGGEPIVDSKDKAIGPMTTDSFVTSTGASVQDYAVTKMTLYFANADGTKLVPEAREVHYSENTPLEQVVVAQLKMGPRDKDHFPTLSTDYNVLNVTIQDDICYVNFDETVLNVSSSIDPEIQIYSIVNSLYNVCKVEKVSFSVNGSNEVKFKDKVELNQVFSPRMDLTEE